MTWQHLVFAVLAAVTLGSALRVVTTPLVPHAALFLALSFVGVAGFFVLLGAEFLAAVQVLIYVGAVMTVTVFAIMLSDVVDIRGAKATLTQQIASPYWGLVPLVVAVALVVVVLAAFGSAPLDLRGEATASAADLGRALFSTYVIPFEVASVLLLAAMVGAIILSRREG
ncbi:MAG: NADH-quinone oxidoreductase subunit J [Clostridia bacterium]|nr:NADH-quinone oxidoreductase subunit J [Clostridia bacterium]